MRTNGFQSPNNILQIFSWMLFLVLILHFMLFLCPSLPLPLSIPLSALFGFFTIASTYYCYVTTKTDSMDERLYEHLNGIPHINVLERKTKEMKLQAEEKRRAEETHTNEKNKQGENKAGACETIFLGAKSKSNTTTVDKLGADESNFGENIKGLEEDFLCHEEEEIKFCWECQIDVNIHSIHCIHCAKCVCHYDHHCVWFNTCIGSKNYVAFYRSVICITLLNSVHLATLILYLTGYFTDSWDVRTRSQIFDGGFPVIVMVVNMSVMAFVFFILLIIMQLLMFHQRLRRDGISTYQFTVKMSQLEHEKTILSNQIREKRNLELSRIRLEGGSLIERACIQMGGLHLCMPCDPVRNMLEEKTSVEEMDESILRENDSDSDLYQGCDNTIASNLYQGTVKMTDSLLSLIYNDCK